VSPAAAAYVGRGSATPRASVSLAISMSVSATVRALAGRSSGSVFNIEAKSSSSAAGTSETRSERRGASLVTSLASVATAVGPT
jgi:hypothetical protein